MDKLRTPKAQITANTRRTTSTHRRSSASISKRSARLVPKALVVRRETLPPARNGSHSVTPALARAVPTRRGAYLAILATILGLGNARGPADSRVGIAALAVLAVVAIVAVLAVVAVVIVLARWRR